ncbi:uncharacterized protein LOC122387482 [Amphibalanus amphitrite]|uniref:uncharacterized protein LOC122387482 n=1 Tax=Amphibalanus amphitrite TaxID=1232801 RepID=UPI001C8FFF81|nr:uncharacterized protein LOC122387482 [Amphibalanus amphitrite]
MLFLGVLLWSALLGAYSAQVESRIEQTAVANVGTATANLTLSRSERDLSWITSWLPWRRQEPGTTTELPGVSSNDRKAKFLNIFTIVRFANEECRGDNNLNGTCVSPDECRSRGGQEAGKCANGYGVCCTMTGSCGNFTRYNNSYFESTDAGNTPNCQFTVYRDSSARICQLRLDFDTFRLAQPDNASGQCTTDAFSVSGVVNAVPVICGENSRTHMYIDVDPNSDRTVLQISTTQGSTQTTTLARDWKIKIQQIECNSTTRAPSACLQYYTGVSGTIKSFNFDGSEIGPHLASQSYSICIRDEALYCSIEYIASPVTNPFRLGQQSSSQKSDQCLNDFLIIAGISQTGVLPQTGQTGGTTNNQGYDRHCGGTWAGTNGAQATAPTPAITYMKPYVVRVRFDDTEGQGETDNRGFSLNFIQKPCSVLGRRKRAALPWRMAPWGNGTVQGGRATWKTLY